MSQLLARTLGSIHTQPARPASAAKLAGTSMIARSARSNAAIAPALVPGCPESRRLALRIGLISIGDIVKWRVQEYENEQEALQQYIKTA